MGPGTPATIRCTLNVGMPIRKPINLDSDNTAKLLWLQSSNSQAFASSIHQFSRAPAALDRAIKADLRISSCSAFSRELSFQSIHQNPSHRGFVLELNYQIKSQCSSHIWSPLPPLGTYPRRFPPECGLRNHRELTVNFP